MSQEKPVKKRRPDSTLKKTAARVAAIQAFYEYLQNPPEHGLDDLISEKAQLTYEVQTGESEDEIEHVKPNPKLIRELLEGGIYGADTIDPLLKASLPGEESLDHIGPLISSILKIACYEMVIAKSAPVKVIIGEYATLAGAFLSNSEAGLVTAVLDKISKKTFKH